MRQSHSLKARAKRLIAGGLFLLALPLSAQVVITPGGGGTSLPTQTGNASKFLTTNGTSASWAYVFGADLTACTGLAVLTAGTATCTSTTGTGAVVLADSPTFTTKALFPSGSPSAPGVAFSSQTNTGMLLSGVSPVLVSNGTNVLEAIQGDVQIGSTTMLSWCPTGSVGCTPSLSLSRRAAATLQHGAADSATPVAQTVAFQGSRGGTDSNVAGKDATIQASLGTGTAVPAAVNVTAGALGTASGSAQHTAVKREGIGWTKVLTNNSAITVASAALAVSTCAGGVIRYTVEVSDGTNFQMESGVVNYGGCNKAGVFTMATPTKGANSQALTSGTLTVTVANSGANPSLISVNANSSLTPSAGYPRITYNLDNLSTNDVTIQ